MGFVARRNPAASCLANTAGPSANTAGPSANNAETAVSIHADQIGAYLSQTDEEQDEEYDSFFVGMVIDMIHCYCCEGLYLFLECNFGFPQTHSDHYFFGIHSVVERIEEIIRYFANDIEDSLSYEIFSSIMKELGFLDEHLIDYYEFINSFEEEMFDVEYQDYLFNTGCVFIYETSPVHAVEETSPVHIVEETTSAPVHAVEETSPVHAVEETSPVHAVEETSPVHAVEETSPVHAVEETSPVHAVEETSPVHAVEETSPVQAVEETSPVHAVEETSPVQAVEETSPVHAVEETSPVHAVEETTSAPVHIGRSRRPFDPARYDRIRGILYWFEYSRSKKWVKSLGRKCEFVQFTGQRPNENSFEYSLMIADDGLPVPSQLFKYYPAQMISFVIWYFNKHHSISNHPLSEMSWYEFIQHLLGDKYHGIANCGRVFVDGVQTTNCPVNWIVGQSLVISYGDSSHTEDFNAIEVVGTKVTVKFTDDTGLLKVVKFSL
jgi:hypothetical protein